MSVNQPVYEDIHICGICKAQYNTIETFIVHKQQCIPPGLQTCVHQPANVQAIGSTGTPTTLQSSQASNQPIHSDSFVVKQDAEVNPLPMVHGESIGGVKVIGEVSQEQGIEAVDPNANESGYAKQDATPPFIPVQRKFGVPEDIYPQTSQKQKDHGKFTNENAAEWKPAELGEHQGKILDPNLAVRALGMAKKTVDSKMNYYCTYPGCDFTTAYRKGLERHIRTHTGEKPYICTDCNKAFARKDKLRLHKRLHTGVKPYKCNQCTYATTDNSSLKKHLRIHSNERPFKCQVCAYASRNSSQLIVHLRTHTGDSPFVCPTCNAKFKINSDLKRHMRLHTGEKPFECPHCDYKCAIKGNLKTHININHSKDNSLKCDKCDFETSSRRMLNFHSRKEHSPEKLSKCSQCDFTTTNAGRMRTHIEGHNPNNPYRCDHCSYTCKQKTSFRAHMQKYHSDQIGKKKAARDPHRTNDRLKPMCYKSFKCSQCEESFVREDSLRSHLKQHLVIEQEMASTALAVLQLRHPVKMNKAQSTQKTAAAVGSPKPFSPPKSPEPSNPSPPQQDIDDGSSEAAQSAIMNQAANNLLAFMQNNRNMAVEDNIQNAAICAARGEQESRQGADSGGTIREQPMEQTPPSNSEMSHCTTSNTNEATVQIINPQRLSIPFDVQNQYMAVRSSPNVSSVNEQELPAMSTPQTLQQIKQYTVPKPGTVIQQGQGAFPDALYVENTRIDNDPVKVVFSVTPGRSMATDSGQSNVIVQAGHKTVGDEHQKVDSTATSSQDLEQGNESLNQQYQYFLQQLTNPQFIGNPQPIFLQVKQWSQPGQESNTLPQQTVQAIEVSQKPECQVNEEQLSTAILHTAASNPQSNSTDHTRNDQP